MKTLNKGSQKGRGQGLEARLKRRFGELDELPSVPWTDHAREQTVSPLSPNLGFKNRTFGIKRHPGIREQLSNKTFCGKSRIWVVRCNRPPANHLGGQNG
jgi:hypothetical protein